jgi:hypothetical protein
VDVETYQVMSLKYKIPSHNEKENFSRTWYFSQVTKVLQKELKEAADRFHVNFYELCLTYGDFRIERL